MKEANLSCGCRVTKVGHFTNGILCKTHTSIGQSLHDETDQKRKANFLRIWND